MQVAKYTVGIQFDINKKEWKRLDAQLKLLEKKLKAFSKKLDQQFSIKITNFDINQRNLTTKLGNALDMATRATAFEISRFSIDQQKLNRAMSLATRRASAQANATVNADVNGGGNPNGHNFARAGALGGITARAYGPALAVGLGGYGLGMVNKRNQEVVSAQMQTQAVLMGLGGTREQGIESFDWLRSQADRVGFNYLDSAGDYNVLTSNLMGAGGTLEDSQQVFKGFAEFGRVNKLSAERQKLVFNALSQIAGKDKLQAEELTKQLGNSLPGAKNIFAQAWQQKTGGNLTGSAAIIALEESMKEGKVRGDILPIAAAIASQMAQPGLTQASKASQAEQARFQNAYNDQAIVASNNGVESGFARLFNTLTVSAKEAQPLIESMARGFDNVSKAVSFALLSAQSLKRFFEGRDSFLGDKFFPDEESQTKVFLFMENTKSALEEMVTLLKHAYNGWYQLLNLLDSSSILDKLNRSMSVIANGMGAVNALVEGDLSAAKDMAASAGKGYINNITAPGRAGFNAAVNLGAAGLEAMDPRVNVGDVPRFQLQGFSTNPSNLDFKNEQDALRKQAAAQRASSGFPGTVGVLPIGSNVDIKMDVKIQAANPEDFNEQFQQQFRSVIQSTLLQSTQKE